MLRPVIYFVDDDYPTNVYNEIIVSQIARVQSYKIFDDAVLALEEIGKAERKPNIIFLDINMPILSGWEFVTEIEKSPANYLEKPYCIIMLSTSLRGKDKEKYAASDLVKSMIEKPLTEEKILAAIDAFL